MRKRILSMLLTVAMLLTLMPMAFAGSGATVSVTMGNTTLTDGEIYVPATGDYSQYLVATQFVRTGGTTVPMGGYIEYTNGTITVHGDVTFTSGGSSTLKVTGGTLKVTGDSSSSLKLQNGKSYAAEISSADLVLDGDVNFSAEQTSSVPTVSLNGAFKTNENYSGNITISGKNVAIYKKSTANVDLTTSGDIELTTTGDCSLVTADALSLKGSHVKLNDPNVSVSMLNIQNDISITSTEGNLIFKTTPTGTWPASPIIASYNNGEVTLNAPNGNIEFSSTNCNNAVLAKTTTVKQAQSFTVEGQFTNGISGAFVVENCPVIKITGSGCAVTGNMDIDGGGTKTSSAEFASSKNYCIIGTANIKNYAEVTISSLYMAVSGNTTLEDCGTVRISNKYTASTLGGNVKITNCDDVTIENSGTGSAINEGFDILTYDKKGKLTLTQNGTTTTTVNGNKDITNTGLTLDIDDGLPTEKTTYATGDGTITFIPKTKTDNAKLVLNNATITTTDSAPLNIDFDSAVKGDESASLDIEVHGENTLNVTGPSDGDFSAGIYFAGDHVNITGDGDLKIFAKYNAHGLAFSCTKATLADDVEININASETGFGIWGNYNTNITICGNSTVNVTTNNYGIHTYGHVTINDSANVTASGHSVDIIANEFTTADTATVNALVVTSSASGETQTLTIYGECQLGVQIAGSVIGVGTTASTFLAVKKGAVLTIPESDNDSPSLTINKFSALTVEGKIINNGTIQLNTANGVDKLNGNVENNGTIILLSDVANVEEVIKAMKLTGSGTVEVKDAQAATKYYTNDGTALAHSNEITLPVNDYTTLPTGCTWDSTTNTLTLENVLVGTLTNNVTGDVTIQTKGSVMIGNITSGNSNTLTMTGETVNIDSILISGNLVIATKNADIGSIDGGDGIYKLTFRNTTAAVKTISWTDPKGDSDNTNYGVELINSKVTVGDGFGNDQFFAGKITMDEDSVLTLNKAPIKNYGKYPNGMDGLKPYVPTGYKVGKYMSEETDNPYTILDADGNIVDTITLKKQESAKPDGGGSSGNSTTSYAITVKDSTNGAVAADRKTASSGTTVTLTVKSNQGWTLETLTVLDAKGKEIDLNIEKVGEKYTFKMPSGKVEIKATFMEDNTILNYFVDVSTDSYYYDAVLWAAEQKVTSGIDNMHFSPDMLCTRAQIVTFLWRAAGSPEPKNSDNPFTDVASGSYYEKAVLWAVENGITTGTASDKFNPNDTCTRAQSVTFLYRAAGSPAVSGGTAFTDVPATAYYANAVAWAAQNKITGGVGDNLFDPNKGCTRAQIVTFLYRMNQTK